MIYQPVIDRSDLIHCMVCNTPACSAACPSFDCGGMLRSIWFENEEYVNLSLNGSDACLHCAAPCQEACPQHGQVPIRDIISKVSTTADPENLACLSQLPSLKTDLFGFELDNPFILSSSVVASNYEMCARAFEMGWAGACFKTLSYLDIHEASPRFSALQGVGGFIGFKNIEQLSDHSVESNLETFRRLKRKYPNKAIIASIMGQTVDEWKQLAMLCEQAGADVLELNFSCPNLTAHDMGSDVGEHPDLVELYTRAVCSASSLPVLAKLTPNTGSMTAAALAAIRGGGRGLAAINTIKSIMGINLHTYVSTPAVHGQSAVGGYSGVAVKPIALRFIAELGKLNHDNTYHISGMGGIETWKDAVEFMMLGATSLQITTAVMEYGYRIIDDLTSGMQLYMAEKGFTSTSQLVGIALDAINKTEEIERDTINYPRFHHDLCVRCDRCLVSCRDGGHQALTVDGKSGRIIMNPRLCVGCHLCILVCPKKAITPGTKRIDKR